MSYLRRNLPRNLLFSPYNKGVILHILRLSLLLGFLGLFFTSCLTRVDQATPTFKYTIQVRDSVGVNPISGVKVDVSGPGFDHLSYESDESGRVQTKKLSGEQVMFSLSHADYISLDTIIRQDLDESLSEDVSLQILKFQLREKVELP